MKVLAEDKDSKDRIIEVSGSVYEETFTDSQGGGTDNPTRTRVHDLDHLMNISWLDPETAETIYEKYFRGNNPFSGGSVRR